eukprot:8710979-Pyramimonas_sp.AAC.1
MDEVTFRISDHVSPHRAVSHSRQTSSFSRKANGKDKCNLAPYIFRLKTHGTHRPGNRPV